jgi:hypothetical protein
LATSSSVADTDEHDNRTLEFACFCHRGSQHRTIVISAGLLLDEWLTSELITIVRACFLVLTRQ